MLFWLLNDVVHVVEVLSVLASAAVLRIAEGTNARTYNRLVVVVTPISMVIVTTCLKFQKANKFFIQ